MPALIPGTREAFTALVVLVAVERLFELWLARRNNRRALAAGGREFGVSHYRSMVLLHATFLAACLIEVWWLERPFFPALAALALSGVCLAMLLRYWVMVTLGDRWTTRIVVRPGDSAVRAGPFRYLRHPNYAAVRIEILLLPLVHTAWLTALLYSLANFALMRVRIPHEERALAELTDWAEKFNPEAPQKTLAGRSST
jgi:methyltransferase